MEGQISELNSEIEYLQNMVMEKAAGVVHKKPKAEEVKVVEEVFEEPTTN